MNDYTQPGELEKKVHRMALELALELLHRNGVTDPKISEALEVKRRWIEGEAGLDDVEEARKSLRPLIEGAFDGIEAVAYFALSPSFGALNEVISCAQGVEIAFPGYGLSAQQTDQLLAQIPEYDGGRNKWIRIQVSWTVEEFLYSQKDRSKWIEEKVREEIRRQQQSE